MRERTVRALSAAIAVLVVWSPAIASACAVCTAGRDDDTRFAFIWTTGLLTFLPLTVLGGGLWWIVRRIRTLDEALDREREAPAESAPPAASVGRTSSLP